ncbi:ABC transporter substrate-binding protein [Cryptosporangium phraense]|uniref:Probable sugar-binding periplasmic protein n=1 Tax=Cryptosporangium phraense TaxID=2593070 RepID=A0A545AQ02_9ACTN|nr:ABC transporter substrate-binding protein [Cryptosporangium phraense]TQS43417.1 ABC transporter substrate-binding protein [Cryptosporangium phraense]
MTPVVFRPRLAAAALVALTALAACAPSSGHKDTPASADQTITFWHGWSQPSELKAINANIAAFEKLHPNIKVKAVSNVTDDKILQGVRTSSAPDVVSSFDTTKVGAFCGGALVDLNTYLKADKVDKDRVYVKSMSQYTSLDGNQCTLPLEADTFGLYYRTDLFAKAGIKSPPKTWSELQADAVKLTKQTSTGYAQLGFMPNFHGYENTAGHTMPQWGVTYFDSNGKPTMATDPAVKPYLQYMKGLQQALGGYRKLEAYRNTFGDEFSAQNAFEAGKVAMQLDGEWRTANLDQDGVKFGWATAPLPVPDNLADQYGRGWTSGTVIGIPAKSSHKPAAWELVKFLTTDTNALVTFANTIHNVPSTYEALAAPNLLADPKFQTFVKIAQDKNTVSPVPTADGDAYLTLIEQFSYKWEAGQVPDLQAGLEQLDQQIAASLKQAGR